MKRSQGRNEESIVKRRGEQKRSTSQISLSQKQPERGYASQNTSRHDMRKNKTEWIPADWILVLHPICFQSPAGPRAPRRPTTLTGSNKTYTHIRNPGRVGPTPEHNANQLFLCSRMLNQSNATTTRREKNGGVTVLLVLRNRLKQLQKISPRLYCLQMSHIC